MRHKTDLQKLLIIEAEPGRTGRLGRWMRREGFAIAATRRGQEAVEAAISTHPDVVFVDLTAGEVDGFEVCRRLKADLRTRLIPIVLLIPRDNRADRVRGLDAGADEVFAQRHHGSELAARVRSLGRLKRSPTISNPPNR